MPKILWAMALLCFANSAQALVSVGSYTPYAFKAQKDSDGGTEKLALNPFVSLNTVIPLGMSGHHFVPEVGYVFHSNNEDETKTNTFFLLYNMSYSFSHRLQFRYGLGTFWTRISGDGGRVNLRNGNTTKDFFVPEESQTSAITTLNLGVEFFFKRNMSVRLDGTVMGFASSDKRSFGHLLSFVYY